ncbi:MAG: hypothetical protein ABIT23_09640 [Nitrosospira sp.]
MDLGFGAAAAECGTSWGTSEEDQAGIPAPIPEETPEGLLEETLEGFVETRSMPGGVENISFAMRVSSPISGR